jgi:hypothetical protein
MGATVLYTREALFEQFEHYRQLQLPTPVKIGVAYAFTLFLMCWPATLLMLAIIRVLREDEHE